MGYVRLHARQVDMDRVWTLPRLKVKGQQPIIGLLSFVSFNESSTFFTVNFSALLGEMGALRV